MLLCVSARADEDTPSGAVVQQNGSEPAGTVAEGNGRWQAWPEAVPSGGGY